MKIKKGFPLLMAMVLAFSPVMVSAEELDGDGDTTQFYKHTITLKTKEINSIVDRAMKLEAEIKTEPVDDDVDPASYKLGRNEVLSKDVNPLLYFQWGPKNDQGVITYKETGYYGRRIYAGGKGAVQVELSAPDTPGTYDFLMMVRNDCIIDDTQWDGFVDYPGYIEVKQTDYDYTDPAWDSDLETKNQKKKMNNDGPDSWTYNYLVETVKVNTRAKIDVKSISIGQKKLTLGLKGKTKAKLDSIIVPENADYDRKNWYVWGDGADVASVDQDGNVTAKSVGRGMVGFSVEDTELGFGETARCELEVLEEYYPVEAVALDPVTKPLNPGQTVDLKANFTPGNATDKSLTWSSSNTSVATVDENGKVTAVGIGRTTVTATSVEDPSISATAVITVEEKKEEEDIPVKKVTLTPTVKTLIPGRTVNLTATVNPADATDKTLTWSSGNKKVATVSKSGKVKAVSPGTTKITVKAGGKKAEATIKVADMKLDTAKLVVKQGSSKTIGGTFVNDKIKSAKVTKDKNKAIEKVTVEKSGKKLKVKAKKGRKGEATVKVTSAAGITQNIKVSVQKDKVTTKKIEILNSSGKAGNSFSVVKGKKITLTIKATPDQVSTGEKPAISKKPDKNTASATINKAGKLVITGKKRGETTMTVKAGKATKTVTIKVKKK